MAIKKENTDFVSHIKAKQDANSAALVSPKTWAELDEACNGVSISVRNFTYKAGEWTVRQTSNGVYLAVRGVYKVYFHSGKILVGAVAAIRTTLEVLWESIVAVFNSALRGSKTAYDVAEKYAKEVGHKLKTSMSSVEDDATTATISPKGIVVQA